MEESRLISVGKSVVDSCRSEIYFNLKFLSLAISRLTVSVEDGLPYLLATDGNVMHVNARWLISAYTENPKTINRTLVHTMLHCIFRHFSRGKNEINPALWDFACDLHVESLIEDINLPFLSQEGEADRRAVIARYKACIPLFTAEGIYSHLLGKEEEALQFAARFYRDDHSLWQRGGDVTSYDKEGESEREESERDWEEIAGKTLADMQFFNQKNAGEALARDLTVDTRRRYSYREFLRKMLTEREVVKEDPDEFDYVFYSYGFSLYGNMPLVEHLEYKEEKTLSELAVIIDTSGSTYQDLAELFLEQTYSVVQDVGGGKFNLRILQCDDAVQRCDRVQTEEEFRALMENFTLIGGGGTDFRPAFSYIDALIEKGEMGKLKGVLYFTDGEGIYPKTVRPYPTAFVFADERYQDKNVPSWAMKLIIGKEELQRL